MGAVSTFIEQVIHVTDSDGLDALKKVSDISDSAKLYAAAISDGDIDFSEWSGLKIEGYWYPQMCDFLRVLAHYIEGYAEFFDEDGNKFKIVFEDMTPYIVCVNKVVYGKKHHLPN